MKHLARSGNSVLALCLRAVAAVATMTSMTPVATDTPATPVTPDAPYGVASVAPAPFTHPIASVARSRPVAHGDSSEANAALSSVAEEYYFFLGLESYTFRVDR